MHPARLQNETAGQMFSSCAGSLSPALRSIANARAGVVAQKRQSMEWTMKSKSHSGSQKQQSANLGQKDATLEKKKESELSHMGEHTRQGASDNDNDKTESGRRHK
jgi:hypothetical protein